MFHELKNINKKLYNLAKKPENRSLTNFTEIIFGRVGNTEKQKNTS